ncbi:tetratricopeptide repeat protein [Actinomycetospora straminea]|uniref:Tetratricopeptide repeat protein n=1 Tax=Actinomycetospora straminea TaxID=663607 RepID=A0ABP9EGY1_9PSEU|nr:tetratricopeptide repeat protein [Actinomycetospora straminea]MDD7933760.1 tetratricopeptide repeat protein [Actinomycetospora straminea]
MTSGTQDELVALLQAAVRNAPGGVLTAASEQAADQLAELLGPPPAADPRLVHALAVFHLARFQALDLPKGEEDLGAAMAYFSALHDRYPELVPESLRKLVGVSSPEPDGSELLRAALDQGGDGELLREAVALLRAEIDHEPAAALYANLGVALRAMFEETGDRAHLDDAVEALTRAVDAADLEDESRVLFLSQLGAALRERSGFADRAADLDAAVQYHREATGLARGAAWPPAAQNLGNALTDLHQATGDETALREAIEVLEAASTASLNVTSANSLGVALRARYDLLGALPDLDRALGYFQAGVDATSAGDPTVVLAANNLGTSWAVHFEHSGQLDDLRAAEAALRTALDATVERAALRPLILGNLANVLHSRFEEEGDTARLAESVGLLRETSGATADDDADLPMRLTNLAVALSSRYERFGTAEDLREAIDTAERAVELVRRPGERAALLGNLGNLRATAFEVSGDRVDLDTAVAALTDAVESLHTTHPDRARHLNNLGLVHRQSFERSGSPADLDHAIAAHEAAVAIGPSTSAEQGGYLSNLGSALLARFHVDEAGPALDEAIARFRQARAVVAPDHPDRAGVEGNLASALITRAERDGPEADGDLAEAQTVLAQAAGRHDTDYPGSALTALHSGRWADLRYRRLTRADHDATDVCLDGLAAFQLCASDDRVRLSSRIDAARGAASLARRAGDLATADAAGQVVLALLPSLVTLERERPDREHRLVELAGLGGDAAEVRLRRGDAEAALALLEGSRAVLWSQLVGSRRLLDRLRSVDPELAARLTTLTTLLNSPPEINPALSARRTAQRRRAETYREWRALVVDAVTRLRRSP